MKPQMKHKLTITWKDKEMRFIYFDTDYNTAQLFKEFGDLTRGTSPVDFHLRIDARYDFDEVLAYFAEVNSAPVAQSEPEQHPSKV